MNDSVRLTVGLPVFNGELYINETIDSILNQTYRNFRLLISDNASTDATLTICKNYARQDSRIHIEANAENMGAAWNYNRVFELCRTEYFKWAAADDTCEPTFFERCIEIIDQDPSIVLSYPQSVTINAEGKIIEECDDRFHIMGERLSHRYRQFHDVYRDENHKSNPIFGIIRTNILAQTQLIGSYTGSDVVLLGELAILGKIHEVPERLFYRRDHPQASVRAYKLQERASWFDPKILSRYQYAKWRLFREYLNSVQRIDIPWVEKIPCQISVGKWFFWNIRTLRKEFGTYLMRLVFQLPKPILNFGRMVWRFNNSLRRRS